MSGEPLQKARKVEQEHVQEEAEASEALMVFNELEPVPAVPANVDIRLLVFLPQIEAELVLPMTESDKKKRK